MRCNMLRLYNLRVDVNDRRGSPKERARRSQEFFLMLHGMDLNWIQWKVEIYLNIVFSC